MDWSESESNVCGKPHSGKPWEHLIKMLTFLVREDYKKIRQLVGWDSKNYFVMCVTRQNSFLVANESESSDPGLTEPGARQPFGMWHLLP